MSTDRLTPSCGRLGFTLIELMLALAIAAILAAVALLSYQQMVMKGRRSDAIASLTSVQQAQERWRGNRLAYAQTLAELGFASDASAKGHYQIALSDVDAGGYTIMAKPARGSLQRSDSACAKMSIRMDGGRLFYEPSTSGCWAQ